MNQKHGGYIPRKILMYAGHYIVEMTGPSEKLDAFVAAIDRTALSKWFFRPTGISRGEKGLHL